MKNSTIFNAAFSMTIKQRSLWLLALASTFNLTLVSYVIQPFINSFPYWSSYMADVDNVRSFGVYISIVIAVMVILMLASLVINVRGNASLVASIDQSIVGYTPSAKEGWHLGRPAFGRLLGWSLLVWVMSLVLSSLWLVPTIIGAIKMMAYAPYSAMQEAFDFTRDFFPSGLGWLAVSIPACCFGMPVSMVLGFFKLLVDVILVIKNATLRDALIQAWRLLRDNFMRVAGFGLLILVIGWAAGMTIGVVIWIPQVLQSIVMVLPMSPVITTGIGMMLGVIVLVIMTVYTAMLGLFNTSAWVYLYRSLESKPVVMAEPVTKVE